MSDGRADGGQPKRFFTEATTGDSPDGWLILLDGRRAMTPARAPLAVPTRSLARAIADEWQAQGSAIDPGTMPLTRLANTAIDGVARETDRVRDDLVRYGGFDLVIYRASEPDSLVAAQAAAWDPVLDWARRTIGARFVLAEGLTFVAQPQASLDRVADVVRREASPFALAALHVMTTLTGSVLIALMRAASDVDDETAWRAAHADELYQESRWGQDLEAARRRSAREVEFGAAARLHELARAA